MLVGSLAGTSLLLVAMLSLPGTARVAVLPLLGLVGLSASPVIMAVSQEAAPSRRSLANGLYMATSFTVRSVVVVAVGALADRIGTASAFTACALLGLLGIDHLVTVRARGVGDRLTHCPAGGGDLLVAS